MASDQEIQRLIERLEDEDINVRLDVVYALVNFRERGIEIDLKKVRNVLTNLTDKKEAAKIYQKINDMIRKGKERMDQGKLSEGKSRSPTNAKGRLVRTQRTVRC